jgi:sucrose synthase
MTGALRPDAIDLLRLQREETYIVLRRWFALGRSFLSAGELRREFAALGRPQEPGDALAELVGRLDRGAFREPWAYLALRERVGAWRYLRLHLERKEAEEIGVGEFLRFEEHLVDPALDAERALEIDFAPFNREFPRLKERRSIGNGVLFLNRHLAGRMFARPAEGEKRLLEFLSAHAIDGQPLLIDAVLRDAATLRLALHEALRRLASLADDTPWQACEERLRPLGLCRGWGDCARSAAETINLLVDILEAPSPDALESFLARIPMISRLLVISPHGYFGQDNVLGLPDTGGQVVYILDQVRALEYEMRVRLARQGLAIAPKVLIVTRLIPEARGTTVDQRLEKVIGCDNTWILRVPFHEADGAIVRQWISRFEIWPYLERFAAEVEAAALAELGGKPDLVIGNYSDGSLVATLLCERLGVTQCNIAHALEKTKYAHSDLRWKELDAQYHFACQYTADLIAMNSADFIITSTYQEIAGTDAAAGQYDSYRSFSLPGLYRVLDGIDPFDPKFNVVSPGASSDIYFPWSDAARRHDEMLAPAIEALVYGAPEFGRSRGHLVERRPLLFTMARLDPIKNIAGLVESYARSPRLRAAADLLVVGGHVEVQSSEDYEEREQIARLHALIDEHRLESCVRWVGTRLDRVLAGGLYRHIADLRGAFVQPALFEAFGLTLIEAMASGLPVFATCHGGPSEIVRDGVSGFQIDPYDGAAMAERIAEFLERAAADPAHWMAVSRGALARVDERYTWRKYAERMMTLSRIYGFWKFASNLEREETRRYLHMFRHLQFKPLAAAVHGA